MIRPRVQSAPDFPISEAQVRAFRLRRHFLGDTAQNGVLRVLAHLTGVQAQVMSSAELALGVRTRALTPAAVQHQLIGERSLVKAWAMRGTLHLLAASDFGWVAAALAPAAERDLARYLRHYRIMSEEAQRLREALHAQLVRGPLTRRQLAQSIKQTMGPNYQELIEHSWGGFLRQLSRTGDLVFGPSHGQEVTFVASQTWLGERDSPPSAWGLSPTAALFLRFLQGYGPASPQDFSYWSGLPAGPVRSAIHEVTASTVRVLCQQRTLFICSADLDELTSCPPPRTQLQLLPAFDAYLLAHKDKQLLLDPLHYRRVFRAAGWVSPTVLVDGRIEGVWSYRQRGQAMAVTVEFWSNPPPVWQQLLEERLQQLAAYWQREVDVTITLPEEPNAGKGL